MEYFIGITPPDDYLQQVLDFQKSWQDNLLPYIVDPHITVKTTGGLTDDLEWLEEIKNICAQTASFDVQLDKPGWFGPNVLFLSVHSSHIFPLHQSLIQAIKPPQELIKEQFESDAFHAHLTLGNIKHGMSTADLKDMEKRAILELQPYPSFTVDKLRIYQSDDTLDEERFYKLLDIPFQIS